jgi:hypothetical protein
MNITHAYHMKEKTDAVKPVYKGHWREPENVLFMSCCSLYTGSNYVHYSFIGETETALYRQ